MVSKRTKRENDDPKVAEDVAKFLQQLMRRMDAFKLT